MADETEIGALKAQVAESSQILDHQGLVDYHGHVSARIPGTGLLLIKPVARPHYAIKPEDILTVDIEEYAHANQSQWDPSKQQGPSYSITLCRPGRPCFTSVCTRLGRT